MAYPVLVSLVHYSAQNSFLVFQGKKLLVQVLEGQVNGRRVVPVCEDL